MAHPVCLAHLSLIELAPPQLVEAAADAGFRQVGMRLAPAAAGEHQHPMMGGAPMMRETLACMRDRGVAVHDVELVRLAGDSDVAALEPLMAAAAELGARQVLVAGDDPDEGALAQRFASLCELGRTYGLRMGLEFMPWRGIRTLASAQRVVRAAGAGGVVVDAIHLDRSGGTADELLHLPASEWAWFQACDAPSERPVSEAELLFQARMARLPPGQGGLNLTGMLRALPPDTVVSIEAPLHGRLDLRAPVDRARLLRKAMLDVMARAQCAVDDVGVREVDC
jgi:sugar phosphate isomerase/epimerase